MNENLPQNSTSSGSGAPPKTPSPTPQILPGSGGVPVSPPSPKNETPTTKEETLDPAKWGILNPVSTPPPTSAPKQSPIPQNPAKPAFYSPSTTPPSAGSAPHKNNEAPHFLSFERVIETKGKESAEDKKAGIRLLRTLQDDIAATVKDDKTSVVQMAIAENRRRDEEKAKAEMARQEREKRLISESAKESRGGGESKKEEEKLTPLPAIKIPEKRVGNIEEYGTVSEYNPRRSMALVIGGVLLIILGLGAVAGVYFWNNRTVAITPTPIGNGPVIFSNYNKEFNSSGKNRTALVNEVKRIEIDPQYSLESVVNLVITKDDTDEKGPIKRLQTTAELFKLLDTRAPGTLIRSLSSEYVLGIYVGIKSRPFLIFKTNFFENAFAQMLAWERTMDDDLVDIFTSRDNLSSGGGAVVRPFEDRVIKNKDTRVLTSPYGETILIYSFINPETLVIAPDEATFLEVYKRLTAARSI